ncbi:hypothetical protein ABZ379_05955 [Streptomyces canus]|uniref:hypothetical protein n=1 Tax=Streptomyces canus TaxID=58343 RepID=UPI003411F71E
MCTRVRTRRGAVRKSAVRAGVVAACTALLTVAAPGTVQADDTATTFAVQAGTLDITVPATENVGTGSPGAAITSPFDSAVTVTDDRAAVTAAWTVTVDSTDFTGDQTPAQTIVDDQISYWSGPATATSGGDAGGATPVFTPGQATSGAAQNLSAARTAFTLTGGSGNNSASFVPTLIINVPAVAVAGTYSGTVSHTVA